MIVLTNTKRHMTRYVSSDAVSDTRCYLFVVF
uniref:Uncharacterized protein n=1 Tax=Anguilla anguilla TaxID=7936 RepID=A0A0E9VPC6_ANGAN